MSVLSPGDLFPVLDVRLVGGQTLALPDALAGSYGVVLFNRGAWCPFCTIQLRQFERAQERLTEIGVQVVSLSVDDEVTATALVEENKLTFAVGHSVDGRHLAELTGAFVNNDPVYLQATGFVLDPEGRVLVSSYSSGAIGRLTAEDTLGLVRYVKEHAA